ncbi:MAG: methyltransferase domain-containing protein [Burkholderiaceae bacterium]
MSDPRFKALVEEAVAPYRSAGRFALGFARGKLGGDPAFEWMLRQGLLSDRRRVLDLGCGQGLLAALLLTADHFADVRRWPADWPAPPESPAVHGIELMPADVARANHALGRRARIVVGDIVDAPYSPSDAVVILDVLHYLDDAAQQTVLDRVRDCLVEGGPGGRLLLRVGDAAGGWRFRASQLVDHVVTTVRGHRLGRLYCRTVPEWTRMLQQRGFRVDPQDMSTGTPFANVLLTADLP